MNNDTVRKFALLSSQVWARKQLKSSCSLGQYIGFQLPLGKYCLPYKHTIFMPYQLHHLLGTVNNKQLDYELEISIA